MIDVAVKLLQKNNYKITKQRLSLLEYLSHFQEQYINVVAVDKYMHSIYPGMSHNTIYRNIKEFEEVGIVEQRIKDGNASVKYQCDFVHQHHHHFICTHCGKVQEVEMCPLDYFEKQLPGCRIEEHHFELYGLCADCIKLSKD
ncbi:Fur family transcriptional regulator [Liquorilactobacillus capillatus]|uniref:Ferric uptake regulation protein n=1 Tax=Liquorilactobacillus capillatus DSM 19910 TaxID=1423731 RepID=A0A0R1M901_9LACO|nr:transcriptional repressor [Liquorilactobacillus capillatus]KRL00547.1 ferric uptake regulation protein [Liquorilactobacillus capillatus DSM 19910]